MVITRVGFAGLLSMVVLHSAVAGDRVISLEVKQGLIGDAVHNVILESASADFGGAILIEQNSSVILKAGYGYANREQRTPFTSTTIAQIGSISKSFTGAAVAVLEAKGQINPGDAVSRYLPELAGKPAGSVTIQQLLTHTGGYPEYCGDDFDRVDERKLLVDCIAPLTIASTKYSYSNAGYSVLAVIVERVSGLSLERFISEMIAGPLGMTDTGYIFPSTARDRLAVGYLNGTDQGVISDRIAALHGEYWALKGNGGIQSTTGDMSRWGRALFSMESRLPAMAQRLSDRKSWVVSDDAKVYYSHGINIALRDDGSVQRMSHTGSDGVFWSLFRWYPKEKIFIYLVGNSGEDDVKKAALPAIAALRKAAAIGD